MVWLWYPLWHGEGPHGSNLGRERFHVTLLQTLVDLQPPDAPGVGLGIARIPPEGVAIDLILYQHHGVMVKSGQDVEAEVGTASAAQELSPVLWILFGLVLP